MANSTQARLLNLEPAELERVQVTLMAAHPEVGAVDLRDVIEQKSDQLIDEGIRWLEGLPWVGAILKIPVVGSLVKGKIRDRLDAFIPDELEVHLKRLAADLIGRIQV